jgi:hypothetical protein
MAAINEAGMAAIHEAEIAALSRYTNQEMWIMVDRGINPDGGRWEEYIIKDAAGELYITKTTWDADWQRSVTKTKLVCDLAESLARCSL